MTFWRKSTTVVDLGLQPRACRGAGLFPSSCKGISLAYPRLIYHCVLRNISVSQCRKRYATGLSTTRSAFQGSPSDYLEKRSVNMNRMLKPAIVFLACLALAGCETTISSVTDSISSREPAVGQQRCSIRTDQSDQFPVGGQPAAASQIEKRPQPGGEPEKRGPGRNGQDNRLRAQAPERKTFNETLTCDPGMLYVMHDKNCTAAREEIVRIDKETNHLRQQEASLKAERANRRKPPRAKTRLLQ